ncbi:Regulatory protein RecX [Methylophaga thiooxydans]|uniref:Regulatory protein RecX n=1 Tax=Methylophaga thiooxydans TaxID=392484 RepID=A0A0A0BG89_9GAMM|nr:regulatory protein RecX [Methylophaga thiooxydans]KGM06880.1 Regulatory protein RecX [Methylophaga thiooxydans]
MKQSASARAVGYLANREHSALELSRKLQKAGFDQVEIEDTIAQLQQAGLQSDERFAESFVSSRANRGYGSVRIGMELKERGVNSDIITTSLQQADIDWFALAIEVRCKRFGEHSPDDFKDRAKQQRFLQYRGFTHEQITESFNLTNNEK